MFALLIAVIVFVFFVIGFVVGTLLVIAIRINLEDRAATKRMLTSHQLEGSILLHEEPQGAVAGAVRRLLVGQRNGPSQRS